MKSLAIAIGLAVLAPSLAFGHGGGLDAYGCHEDKAKGNYHCHKGKLEGRTYKSQDTMLTAHPELRDASKAEGERMKKEKAEDKVKDGDKTTTQEYAKDKKKAATPSR